MESTFNPSSLLAVADAAFRRARGTSIGDSEVGTLLAQVVESAREAWPELDVPLDAFVEHLVARIPEDCAPVDALLVVRGADLLLAFACARGDEQALRAFDATLGPELRVVHARVRGPKPDFEDFRQECHKKLFLAAGRPKIADYSGHGDLRSWLRVTLLRTLIDLGRKSSARERPTDDERVLDIPTPGDDPEIELLKRTYRHEFKRSLEESAAELSPEERSLLRAHLGQGLGIDQLASLHHVHRATVARRIARARDALLAGTRRRLMMRLKLDRSELDSVMRMIESNVHASLQRMLESGAG